jgi:hypothetical protein
VGNPEGKRPLGKSIRGWGEERTRLAWYGVGSSGLGQEPVVGSYARGNEPSVFIKFRKILEQLRDWWHLKTDSAPCRDTPKKEQPS